VDDLRDIDVRGEGCPVALVSELVEPFLGSVGEVVEGLLWLSVLEARRSTPGDLGGWVA